MLKFARMTPISFDDPNPNIVENVLIERFRNFAEEFRRKTKQWEPDVRWDLETLSQSSTRPSEVISSVVTLEIMCRRKCCMGYGGAPDHLVHSLNITSEFGICNKFPKYWRVYGRIGEFDPEMDETPIERFLAVVQFDVEQPDEAYLEEVKKKLDDLPMVLDYVSKDTTRWTKREY